MDNVIISTKNTNTKYKNTGIARAVLICLVGILIVCGCFFSTAIRPAARLLCCFFWDCFCFATE